MKKAIICFLLFSISLTLVSCDLETISAILQGFSQGFNNSSSTTTSNYSSSSTESNSNYSTNNNSNSSNQNNNNSISGCDLSHCEKCACKAQ